MLLVVIYALVVAIFVSFEIMANKWLMLHRGINGDLSGIYFLLVEGTIGTVSLLISTLLGKGLYLLSLESFFMVILAGLLAYIAIVIINFAISIGLAGVVISIFNTNASI